MFEGWSQKKVVLSYISRMTKQKINTKLINAWRVSRKFKRRNNLFKLEIPLERRMSFAQNLQPEDKNPLGNDQSEQVLWNFGIILCWYMYYLSIQWLFPIAV